MVAEKTGELAAGFNDIGHPINAYHLINYWHTITNKLYQNSSLTSKLLTHNH